MCVLGSEQGWMEGNPGISVVSYQNAYHFLPTSFSCIHVHSLPFRVSACIRHSFTFCCVHTVCISSKYHSSRIRPSIVISAFNIHSHTCASRLLLAARMRCIRTAFTWRAAFETVCIQSAIHSITFNTHSQAYCAYSTNHHTLHST